MSENPSCPRERESMRRKYRGDAYIHGGEESVCERERERERERGVTDTEKILVHWHHMCVCECILLCTMRFFSLFVGVASRARIYKYTHRLHRSRTNRYRSPRVAQSTRSSAAQA